MSNDLNTLSGALLEMKDQLIYELGEKGVTASYNPSTGLLGLIGKISEIQTGGGSCYKVTFDNASYTTTGSVTVSVTVLKNYSACVGETVTFTSSTSPTTTATTDSNGVATATINFSASTTLTASIGGATDTCTVTVQSYLFYDECSSADGLTNYGAIRPISSSTTTSYLEYDSTENAYYVHANGDWGVIPITALNGLDNYKISGEFKTKSSANTYQGGLGFMPETGTNSIIFRKFGTSSKIIVNLGTEVNICSITNASSVWHKFEVTKQGRNYTVTVTDMTTGNVVGTKSYTYSSDTYYVGFMTVAGTNYGSYVRNVKAEPI